MSDWSPPEEFDDYVIERPLGHGAMGRVFLAHDAVLARPVAVKFIAAVEPDAASRQRFLLEARATARLQHPNVVAIYRVGELDSKPYIVTEFVRGDTLDKVALPMPGARVLELGIELSRGLAAAHRRGVIHGDIKPGNAIVGEDGTAKLLDFGLATLADHAPAGGKAKIAGTPDYMAPELWRGQAADRRTDVYALGAVLYHLLSGAPPFHDVPPRDLPKVVQERDPPRLGSQSGSARLIAAIDRCLARDPTERWASGDELREALEQSRAQAAAAAVIPSGNPYRGLRPFEADHRQLFFGRTAELGVVLDRLRAEPFVLVAGESGSGKSSLVRAAVLPALVDGAIGDGRTWSSVTLVPGRRPLRALAAAFATAFEISEDAAAAALRGDGAAIRAFVRDKLGAGRGLVVFVDQLEEIATIAEPDEATAADRALARLGTGAPGFRLIATARADFLGRLAALPDIGDQLTRALAFLRPLGPDEIREVIVGPATATGVRFETEAMVDELVAATAGAEGGLPLLQFALAELWSARDEATSTITAAALASLGGVEGALSRHADQVIAAMTPAQQAAARRMLTRLVTAQGTRTRRSETELTVGDLASRAALDALVRGRLLVAHEGDDGSAYELSHEVLVRGWTTLRQWIVEDADQRLLADRVHAAASEWDRLKQARDGLWSKRQLDEAARVVETELRPLDRDFLAASRAKVRRRWWTVRGAIVAVPALIAAVYFGVQLANQRALRREVDQLKAAAELRLANAHADVVTADDARARAFTLFDSADAGAEASWATALAADQLADHELSRSASDFEAALSRDPRRTDVRRTLGEILLERALRAERDYKLSEASDLIDRLPLYDVDHVLMARWQEPAHISLALQPPGAKAELIEPDGGHGQLLGADNALAPGSYVLAATAPGRAPVRLALRAPRGGRLALAIELPPAAAVPPGFLAIPPGAFLFGITGDEGARVNFYLSQPLHERRTDGYLIAAHEVTCGEWIAFLMSLPPAERRERLPHVESEVGMGSFRLDEVDGTWQLYMAPLGVPFTARAGEPMRYTARDHNATLDWSKFPVTAVTAGDAEAYTAWLSATGAVPGARLCTEVEWERAARGADARIYPHGDHIEPDDADMDVTYGKQAGGMGLDEVGLHPRSDSPYALSDMSGNAYEWTTSVVESGGYVLRGGSWWYDRKTAQIANRNVATPKLRESHVGFRVCAPWPH